MFPEASAASWSHSQSVLVGKLAPIQATCSKHRKTISSGKSCFEARRRQTRINSNGVHACLHRPSAFVACSQDLVLSRLDSARLAYLEHLFKFFKTLQIRSPKIINLKYWVESNEYVYFCFNFDEAQNFPLRRRSIECVFFVFLWSNAKVIE